MKFMRHAQSYPQFVDNPVDNLWITIYFVWIIMLNFRIKIKVKSFMVRIKLKYK